MPVHAITFTGIGVRELVVTIMCQRHIATAEVIKFFDIR